MGKQSYKFAFNSPQIFSIVYLLVIRKKKTLNSTHKHLKTKTATNLSDVCVHEVSVAVATTAKYIA